MSDLHTEPTRERVGGGGGGGGDSGSETVEGERE